MNTDIKGISIAAQDQVLAAIKTTQAAILDGVRSVSSSLSAVMPSLPTIPGLDKLPNPADSLELGFGFAERLLASQREFAEQLLNSTRVPVTAAKATKTKS